MKTALAYCALIVSMCQCLLGSPFVRAEAPTDFSPWQMPEFGDFGLYGYPNLSVDRLPVVSLFTGYSQRGYVQQHIVVENKIDQSLSYTRFNSAGPFTRLSFLESGAGYRGVEGTFARNISTSATLDVGLRYVGGEGVFEREELDEWAGRIGYTLRIDSASTMLLKWLTYNHKADVSGGLVALNPEDDINDPLAAVAQLQHSDARIVRNDIVAVYEQSAPQGEIGLHVPIVATEQLHILSLNDDGFFDTVDSIRSLFLQSRQLSARPSIELNTASATLRLGPTLRWFEQRSALGIREWNAIEFGGAIDASLQTELMNIRLRSEYGTSDAFTHYDIHFSAEFRLTQHLLLTPVGHIVQPQPTWYEPLDVTERQLIGGLTVAVETEDLELKVLPMWTKVTNRQLYTPGEDNVGGVFAGEWRDTSDFSFASLAVEAEVAMGQTTVGVAGRYTLEPNEFTRPELYANVEAQHRLEFGRSHVVLAAGAQYQSAGTIPALSPFVQHLHTGSYQEAQWDGAYVTASARMGNADVKLSLTNIAGQLWMPFEGHPSVSQNFSISIDWRFFD